MNILSEEHKKTLSESIKRGFANGRKVWNKGLKGTYSVKHSGQFPKGHKPDKPFPKGNIPYNQRIFITKEELEQLYLTEKLGTRAIAKKIGVKTHKTVVDLLKKYDIPPRGGVFVKGHMLWDNEKSKSALRTSNARYWQDPIYREKMIANNIRNLNNIQTKPEKKLQIILDKHFPDEFKYNGNLEQGVMLAGLVPDFINVNGKKQVIEVFGDYWHNLPNMPFYSTEYGRKHIFSKLGYDCMVLWEHELVGNKCGEKMTEDDLVKRIGGFVK